MIEKIVDGIVEMFRLYIYVHIAAFGLVGLIVVAVLLIALICAIVGER